MYEKLLMVFFVNSSHICFQPISYTADSKLHTCLVVRSTNVGRTSQSFLRLGAFSSFATSSTCHQHQQYTGR